MAMLPARFTACFNTKAFCISPTYLMWRRSMAGVPLFLPLRNKCISSCKTSTIFMSSDTCVLSSLYSESGMVIVASILKKNLLIQYKDTIFINIMWKMITNRTWVVTEIQNRTLFKIMLWHVINLMKKSFLLAVLQLISLFVLGQIPWIDEPALITATIGRQFYWCDFLSHSTLFSKVCFSNS